MIYYFLIFKVACVNYYTAKQMRLMIVETLRNMSVPCSARDFTYDYFINVKKQFTWKIMCS